MSQDLSDRMGRLAALATKAQAQSQGRRDVRAEGRVAVAAQLDAQDAADMKNNGVFQIMAKNNLASDEKINQIAAYLDVVNDDYATARTHFGEFQAYFNHVQNEGMKLDIKGLEKLIEEVQGALKPELERIVNDVIKVQEGADKSKHLLEIMRTARMEGKTIDEIRAAILENDRLVAEVEAINKAIASGQEDEQFRQERLNAGLDAKLASEKGFFNKIARAITGPDKRIATQIDTAQRDLQESQERLQTRKADLEAKLAERNVNLESGQMAILRSIDATEEGFADVIVKTATDSLELIQGSQQSVQRLMKRTAYSKQQAFAINDQISKTSIQQAILEGAIQKVAKNAHANSEKIKARLAAADEQLEAMEDPVEKAALTAERVGIAEVQKAALTYEEDTQNTHSNFAKADGNTAKAQMEAQDHYHALLAQENMLQQMSSQALPETARGLRLGLEAKVGMQNTELASSIQAVTRRAMEIGQQSYKELAATQAELRSADLKLMDDAIAALDAAQGSVVNAAEAQVKFSDEKTVRTGALLKATQGLRELLEQYDDIRARTSDVMPSTAVDVGYGEPVRPATPSNDAGAPAKPDVA